MTIITTCRHCAAEFEADHRVIVAGAWRLCPGCREIMPEMPLARPERPATRRQLTDAQKAQLGRAIEPDIAEQARQRQAALGRSHGETPSDQMSTRGTTREKVAKAVGLAPATYARHKALLEDAEAAAS